MTLQEIENEASTWALEYGPKVDAKRLALCVSELARHQAELIQVLHDHTCKADPALAVKLTDLLEFETAEDGPI